MKRLADYGAVINQPAQVIKAQGKGATAAAMGMLTAGATDNQLMLTEGPAADSALGKHFERHAVVPECDDVSGSRHMCTNKAPI